MRPTAAILASGLALSLAACASKPAQVSTNPLAQCPFNVVATVRNQSNRNYDVYYYAGTQRQMLGQINAGSTVTYTLPGEGRGSVRLFGAQADGGGRPTERTYDIRVHCAGA